MSWTLSVQASVLPLPYRTTYLYIYKYIFIMSNQLSGSVGESQPLTLPGNYPSAYMMVWLHIIDTGKGDFLFFSHSGSVGSGP